MVSEGQEVGDGEQGGAALAGDPTPRGRRVLGVGHDGVEAQLFAQPRHEVEDRSASRRPDDVPDEEQPEAQSNSPTARGRYSSRSVATMLSAGQPVSSIQSSAARPCAQAPALAASYGVHPAREEGPDHTGQHVPRPRRGQGDVTGRVDRDLLALDDERIRALEQHAANVLFGRRAG